MGDFNDRLVASIAKMPGVEWAKIEDGGVDGFRRHAVLVGQVCGKPFRFPLPRRPKEKTRTWLNYLCQMRRRIRQLAGAPTVFKTTGAMTRIKRSRPRKSTLGRLRVLPLTRELTRLDRDPFADLAALAARMQIAA